MYRSLWCTSNSGPLLPPKVRLLQSDMMHIFSPLRVVPVASKDVVLFARAIFLKSRKKLNDTQEVVPASG